MKSEDQNETKVENGQNIDKSRRSFSKKGLVAPVIMTLANRSAWGATDVCIGSGFQSYAAALPNGLVSHFSTSNTNTNWKSPRTGLPSGSSSGWADSDNLSSWPTGITPVRRRAGTPPDRFERWNGTGWSENRNETYARNNWGIVFVDELFGGTPTSQTLYEALISTANNLLAYQIASDFNMRLDNTGTPFPDLISLADYELFYSECVS